MVKLGDKVRFLNSIGGGTVIKIDGRIATVLEEDGFEIPSIISELVVIENVNQMNFPTEQTKNPPQQISLEKENHYSFDEKDEKPEKEQISVYFAFVPKNIKELQTSGYECFLINDSNYYLQFSFFAGDEQPHLLENGELEPQTKLFIQDIEKDELNNFRTIVFQAIALKKRNNFSIKPAIDVHKELNLTKLYKLHSFSENDFFYQPAYLFPIIEKGFSDKDFIVTKDTAAKFFETKKSETKFHAVPKEKNSPLEIDLHINALLDTTAGMSNADMLNYQMQKFHEVMNEYRQKKGFKIVFIHGKGEGILRKEIEKQLKTKYKSCYYQDASFREYGFGATLVTIR